MTHAKVFMSGNSQAIRLPKSFQVKESELCIKRVGSSIVLFNENNPWDSFDRSLEEFPEDFLADGRNQPGSQEREGL